MSVYKPKPVSGFPEWTPEIRLIEQHWLDTIRRIFESYGFTSIETPAVEELGVLMAKGGDTDKEIYTLTRLQADENDKKEARLGLHFDQTVPFARYTAQHFNELTFPFKRYQMQKVWRGERPQAGREREFKQCDIDVINVDSLPIHFDAEMPLIIYKIFKELNIPNFRLQLSNRKILIGLLEALGVDDIIGATRIIDKLDKIGMEEVQTLLKDEVGLTDEKIVPITKLASIKCSDSSFTKDIKALGVTSKGIDEGVEELAFVMDRLAHLPEGSVVADLSIVRGLDYYTGTVYETRLLDAPEYGSVCSGGRYDDLAGTYINKKLPGVGISIGFTRLFEKMVVNANPETTRKCPTDILIVLGDEEKRDDAAKTAEILRQQGHNVEMFHSATKMKKQLAYAEKKGIPYVWFLPFEEGQKHEVKCMKTGKQEEADPKDWTSGI